MKKILKYGAIFGLLMFISGCATNNINVPGTPIVKTIKKEIVYIPSEDEKKAIVILIYKQKQLEKKLNDLENSLGLFKNQKNINQKCKFNKSSKIKISKCNNNDIKNEFIAISDVNIRRCATIHSPIVGVVKKGQKVHFLYCDKYCWCLLKNGKGFVFKRLFKKVKKQNVKKQLVTKQKQIMNKKSNIIKKKAKISNNREKKPTFKETNVDKVIENYINSK